jgi:hypothetical protein
MVANKTNRAFADCIVAASKIMNFLILMKLDGFMKEMDE